MTIASDRLPSSARVAELELPAVVQTVGQVRQFARETLRGWGLEAAVTDAAQLLDELVANAVLHAATPYRVRLIWSGGRLRAEVHDGCPPAGADLVAIAAAEARRATGSVRTAIEHDRGRGLLIVAALATGWGVASRDDGIPGKVVWFELDPP